MEGLLRKMMTLNPRLASFTPFIGKGDEIDPAKLRAAIEHGFWVVRWRIVETR